MRIGLDLRAVTDHDQRLRLAAEADRLGLWAVLFEGGPCSIDAAELAAETSSIHLAMLVDGNSEHPLTLAEEIVVVDHLSERRALVVTCGSPAAVDHLAKLLAGHVVGGVALSPPPAQTSVPIWPLDTVSFLDLSGDLAADGQAIDRFRDGGCTHLFVTWDGSLQTLARHLATRAVGPDFPTIVAEMADRIDPPAD